jgi:hypothetical protein
VPIVRLEPTSAAILPIPHAEVEGREKGIVARPLAQVLLSKLTELELEFLGRIDSFLYEQGIH